MQTSIWENESFYAKNDVAIIGAGMNGLWAAIYLKELRPQWHVCLVDGGSIPRGASTRNAGFACFGSAGEIVSDFNSLGEEQVWNLVRMRYTGLQKIRAYFPDPRIDFEWCGGYELFAPEQEQRYEKVVRLLPKINKSLEGITGTSHLFRNASEAISGFGFQHTSHLLFNPMEGQLHSGKLVAALQEKACKMGVRMLSSFNVKQIEETGSGVWLHSEEGPSLSSAAAMICTNGFARHLIPELDVHPARGQIIVTEPIPGHTIKGCFHFDEGYYYFRNIGNRLLLGGARNMDVQGETTERMETSPNIQTALENFMKKTMFPEGMPPIEYRWAGIMGMGKQKTPIIQPIGNNLVCCVRMSGMGVALSPVAAEDAVRLLLKN